MNYLLSEIARIVGALEGIFNGGDTRRSGARTLGRAAEEGASAEDEGQDARSAEDGGGGLYRAREGLYKAKRAKEGLDKAKETGKKLHEARLRGRGTESEEVIQGRLACAKAEIREAVNYDYVVVNDDADRCADEILNIISKLENELIED